MNRNYSKKEIGRAFFSDQRMELVRDVQGSCKLLIRPEVDVSKYYDKNYYTADCGGEFFIRLDPIVLHKCWKKQRHADSMRYIFIPFLKSLDIDENVIASLGFTSTYEGIVKPGKMVPFYFHQADCIDRHRLARKIIDSYIENKRTLHAKMRKIAFPKTQKTLESKLTPESASSATPGHS